MTRSRDSEIQVHDENSTAVGCRCLLCEPKEEKQFSIYLDIFLCNMQNFLNYFRSRDVRLLFYQVFWYTRRQLKGV